VAKDDKKIFKHPENISPIEHITEPLKNIDELDKLNFQYDRFVEPDVYKNEAGTDNYDLLHDIINYLLESSQPAQLINKLDCLTHILINILENKKEKMHDQYVIMILLRLQGHTYEQIAERVGKTKPDVFNLLNKINDEKILLVLKQSTELNQKKKYNGGNCAGKHKDKLD